MAIQKGSEGAKVRELQTLLNKNGYLVDVDGVFGRRTLNQVVQFQKDKGLFLDGIVGPVTLKELKRDKRTITEKDYQRAAAELGVELAIIKAVESVESSGSGFDDDGRIKILFEGHKFYNELNSVFGNAELKVTEDTADIIYPKWTKKYYNQDQHDRLNRAKLIHETCALRSASWGLFQIMGFNHQACNFPSVKDFVTFNAQSEGNQLLCFVRFCANKGLLPYLQAKDWATFAKKYNGPGYKKNKYDTKLAAAYKKFSKESK